MQARNAQLSLLLALLAAVSILSIANTHAHLKTDIASICSDARASIRAATFEKRYGTIAAKAFVVQDVASGEMLAARDARTALPLASLTKLMTLRIALQHSAPNEFYTVQSEDLLLDPPIGYAAGQTYRIGEITKAVLVASSNNGASMLASSSGLQREDFIAAMNAEARTLGLSTLRYESVSGLDTGNDTIATAWGSARDIVSLLARDAADFPDIMAFSTQRRVVMTDTAGATTKLENTDKAIDRLPLLIASKTGYTDVAGGNLAVLWKTPTGKVLGAAVLGSTESGRFADMIALHDAATAYLAAAGALPDECI